MIEQHFHVMSCIGVEGASSAGAGTTVQLPMFVCFVGGKNSELFWSWQSQSLTGSQWSF